MTSTPRLPNGQPPAEKIPVAKPPKAKKPKKAMPPESLAKPMETAASQPKPMPPKTATTKPAPAKPAPAMPGPPKFAMFALPTFDGAINSFERTSKAAGQGAQAFNVKLFDMARSNVTSGFDFLASLAAAKHPAEIARLQMNYWDGCLRTLFGQGRELQMLSADIVAKANGPIRAHLKQSFMAV